jgi:hypothetical protein
MRLSRLAAVVIIGLGGLSAGDSQFADAKRLAAFGARTMARAQTWYEQDLLYSQDRCFRLGTGYADTDWSSVLGGCHAPYYRTDCSGFVSMAWDVPFSYATPRPGGGSDLGDITRDIPEGQLTAGDALVAAGQHAPVRALGRPQPNDLLGLRLRLHPGKTPDLHLGRRLCLPPRSLHRRHQPTRCQEMRTHYPDSAIESGEISVS